MMDILFYIAATVAMISALFTVTGLNPTHALLNLVITMMAISFIFFLLGAPFAAALQIIVYAGAVMILFVFVTMMLHQGEVTIRNERKLFQPFSTFLPALLSSILLAEMCFVLSPLSDTMLINKNALTAISPHDVGLKLYGPYILLVELAALLLTSALVGAFHLGRRHIEGAK